MVQIETSLDRGRLGLGARGRELDVQRAHVRVQAGVLQVRQTEERSAVRLMTIDGRVKV